MMSQWPNHMVCLTQICSHTEIRTTSFDLCNPRTQWAAQVYLPRSPRDRWADPKSTLSSSTANTSHVVVCLPRGFTPDRKWQTKELFAQLSICSHKSSPKLIRVDNLFWLWWPRRLHLTKKKRRFGFPLGQRMARSVVNTAAQKERKEKGWQVSQMKFAEAAGSQFRLPCCQVRFSSYGRARKRWTLFRYRCGTMGDSHRKTHVSKKSILPSKQKRNLSHFSCL